MFDLAVATDAIFLLVPGFALVSLRALSPVRHCYLFVAGRPNRHTRYSATLGVACRGPEYRLRRSRNLWLTICFGVEGVVANRLDSVVVAVLLVGKPVSSWGRPPATKHREERSATVHLLRSTLRQFLS